jgi:hypothetical protein
MVTGAPAVAVGEGVTVATPGEPTLTVTGDETARSPAWFQASRTKVVGIPGYTDAVPEAASVATSVEKTVGPFLTRMAAPTAFEVVQVPAAATLGAPTIGGRVNESTLGALTT